MRAPLIIIALYLFTVIFDLIVFESELNMDEMNKLGYTLRYGRGKSSVFAYDYTDNFHGRNVGRIFIVSCFYGYIFYRFRQYKTYAEDNGFP